jgi:hypothetical protein
MQPHTTVCLRAVKLIVTSDIEEDMIKLASLQRVLLVTSERQSSIILEDCVFETTFTCPVMSRLVVCAAQLGGQVGPQAAVVARTCNAMVQQRPALPAICCIDRH